MKTKPSQGCSPAARAKPCAARGEGGLVVVLALMTLIQVAATIWSVLS
ncbi:hypothetical protein [Brevundimonas sp.]